MNRRRGRLIAAVVAALGVSAAAPVRAQDERPAAAVSESRDAFTLTAARPAVARPLVVDTTATLSVSVTSPSPILQVALVAPGGERFTIGDRRPPAFDSRAAAASTTLGASTYQATLQRPTPGVWWIEVAQAVTPDADVEVSVVCAFGNAIRLALAGADGVHPAGRPVRLALALFDGSARSRALTVHARLALPEDPGFTPLPVTFSDDGEGADEAADDGIYEAFVDPGRPGAFQLELDVDGTGSTGRFRRSSVERLRVVSRTATIGMFNDWGVYHDADGSLEQLAVSPEVTVLADGSYVVTVRLRGSNGLEIERSAETPLAAGTMPVDVLFDAADIIGELGVDGPYHVVEIACSRSIGDDVVPADIKRDPGDTGPYQLAAFRQPLVRVSGPGAAVGVDAGSTGRFSSLEVTLELIAEVSGTYSFSASVTDASGRELSLAAGSQFLNEGRSAIVLGIPGEPIGRSGIDGPYCVSNLVIFGAGQSVVVGQALITGPFLASQFEGGGASARPLERMMPESEVCLPPNRRVHSPVVDALLARPARAIGNGLQRP